MRFENLAEIIFGSFCESILFGYSEWSDLARDALAAYLRELTTEEFLCRIDIFCELDSYDMSVPQEQGRSVFQECVKRNVGFDPASVYQTMQVPKGRDLDVVPERETYLAEDSKR